MQTKILAFLIFSAVAWASERSPPDFSLKPRYADAFGGASMYSSWPYQQNARTRSLANPYAPQYPHMRNVRKSNYFKISCCL